MSKESFASFEPLLTASEAAELLRIHPVTILRWARESRLPFHRLGRRVAFRASELNLWLDSRSGEHPSGVYTDSAVRAA